MPLYEYGQDRLRSIVVRAFTAPTPDEAGLFGGWLHDENFGSLALEPLVSPPSLRAVRYLRPESLMKSSMDEIYWPFGLAALHDENLMRGHRGHERGPGHPGTRSRPRWRAATSRSTATAAGAFATRAWPRCPAGATGWA